MPLQPIYTPKNTASPAYHLRYIWCGWPSAGAFPEVPSKDFFAQLDARWEQDGMRRLEMHWTDEQIQITFSVKPQVSPIFFTSRAKGRLQHALREWGTPVKFQRKVGFRSIGDNRTDQVEDYLKDQVDEEHFVDPSFVAYLKQFTSFDASAKLDKPTETRSGRYWYNLHLVLVVARRRRFTDHESFQTIERCCAAIARKKGYVISTKSVMPDHLHLAMRGNIEQSPEEISLSVMNNLAYALGQQPVWQFSYYAGTFGEYDMHAVRHKPQLA